MSCREKVLIIKAGYSEILDKESNSRKVSLGDVLRTTVLLHNYKDNDVTWVTDNEAFPLLEGNTHIQRLLPYDSTTILQLQAEEFDAVVNLEKIPGICALSDSIHAWKKYGFRFDRRAGKAEAHDRASETLTLSSDLTLKRENQRTFQELLFEIIGKKWNGEEYILGYHQKSEEKYDVCLNTQVGQKWPTKQWSFSKWDELEERLIKTGLKVTRQDKYGKDSPEILKNLNAYMDWLNSCRIIVSNDSLGLHLGIAMKKKTLGLFGATPSREVYFYNRGKAIIPEKIPICLPCLEGLCRLGRNCMEDISTEKVYKETVAYANS